LWPWSDGEGEDIVILLASIGGIQEFNCDGREAGGDQPGRFIIAYSTLTLAALRDFVTDMGTRLPVDVQRLLCVSAV